MMSILLKTVFHNSIQHFSVDEASATFPIKIKKKGRPLNQQGIKLKDCPKIGSKSVIKKGGLCIFHDFLSLLYIILYTCRTKPKSLCWKQFYTPYEELQMKLLQKQQRQEALCTFTPYTLCIGLFNLFWVWASTGTVLFAQKNVRMPINTKFSIVVECFSNLEIPS